MHALRMHKSNIARSPNGEARAQVIAPVVHPRADQEGNPIQFPGDNLDPVQE